MKKAIRVFSLGEPSGALRVRLGMGGGSLRRVGADAYSGTPLVRFREVRETVRCGFPILYAGLVSLVCISVPHGAHADECSVNVIKNGEVRLAPGFPYVPDPYSSTEMADLRALAAAKNIFVIAGTGTFDEINCGIQGGTPIDMSLPWKDRELDMMKAIVWYVSHLMVFTGWDTATGLAPDDYHPVPIAPDDPEYVKATDLFEAKRTIPAAIRARQGYRRFGWSCGTSAAATVGLAMAHGIPGRLVNGNRIEYSSSLEHDVNFGGDYCCSLFSTKYNRWIFFIQHSYGWLEDRSLGQGGEPIGLKELLANESALANSIELYTDGRAGVGDYPDGDYIVPPNEWVAYTECPNSLSGFVHWSWIAVAAPNNRLRFMPEYLVSVPGTSNQGYALFPPTQECWDTRTYGASATVGWWKSHFRYMLITYNTRPNTGRNELNEFYNGCDYIITEESVDAGFTVADLGGNFHVCPASSPELTYPLNNVHATAGFVSAGIVRIELTHNMFDFLGYETSINGGPWAPLNFEQPDPRMDVFLLNAPPCGTTISIRGRSMSGVHSPDVVMNFDCPMIDIEPKFLSSVTVGSVVNEGLEATGGVPPYAWAIESGTLPEGLSLSAAGVLSGVATATGTSTCVINATDSEGCTGSQSYTMVICPEIQISPSVLPAAWLGASYWQPLSATGAAPPAVWQVAAGTLPGGMTLTTSGLLTGAPNALGTFNFTARAADSAGCATESNYALVVNGCPSISISPGVLPYGTVGIPYLETLTATGGLPPYGWVDFFGDVPSGLFLHPGSGNLAGTPSEAGTWDFTVLTIDAGGCTAIEDVSVTMIAACNLIGDVSGDTDVNGLDIRAFVDCLTSGPAASPQCSCGDIDASGRVDTADVPLFVNALLAP